MLEGIENAYVLADKAYDADALVESLERSNCNVVIPSRKNRLVPRELDAHTYKERHLVENFFQKLKRPRRVCTRYDKLDFTFLSFVAIASILVLIT
jgi:transposase